MSGAALRTSLSVGVVAWRDLANPKAGGSEVVVDHYLRGLRERGHDVRLMCGGPIGDRDYPVHRIGGTYSQYLKAPMAHIKWLRRADVLLDVQNGIPFFSPLWRRKPTVCLVHHVHTEQWRQHFPAPVAAVGRMLESEAMPLAYGRTPYVAVSPGTARDLGKLGIPSDQITVVPNGVELVEPTAPRSEEPLFLALGRLVPHKRIDLLLELWEQVRPFTGGRLVIAGDGPELPALRALAGADVEFTGSVTEEEKQRLLSQAWMLVHTASHEGWGMVVLEAGMVRTPTLAFEVSGLRDTVRHGVTGHLAQSHQELADAWVVLASDAARRQRLGDAAREWATGFTWDRTVDRLEHVLMRAVAGAPARCRRGGVSQDAARSRTSTAARPGRGAVMFWVASLAVGGAAFIVLAALAHAGATGDLAAASAVISISFVLAVVPGAIQLRAAADAAATPARPPGLPMRFVIGSTLALLLVLPALAVALTVPALALALLAGQYGAACLASAQRGAAIGRGDHRAASWSMGVEALVRLAAGIALGLLLGATGLALALLLGSAAAAASGAATTGALGRTPAREVLAPALSVGLLMVLVNLDAFAAPRILGAAAADAYAIAELPARGTFFALFAVSWLAVPTAAQATSLGALLRPVAVVLGLGAAAGLTLLGVRPLLSIALGDPAPPAGLLATLTAAMTLAAALATVLAMAVARDARRPWAPTAVVVVGLASSLLVVDPSPARLATLVLAAIGLAFAGTLGLLWRTAPRRAAAASPPLLAPR
jgi:glycosyltransferase involved in cell wall biosynthesis